MAFKVTMPQLGESVTEGTVGAWLKKVGDRIERDEPLVEIITDKVTAEVPSPVEGVVADIVVAAGETVPVGQVIAVIETEPAQTQTPAVAGNANGAGRTVPVAAREGTDAGTEGRTAGAAAAATGARPAAEASEQGMRRRYSPVVRRLAAEHGIDLTQVPGTGLGGRVTKKDVLAYLEARAADGAAAEAPQVSVRRPAGWIPAPGDVVDADPIRRTIAQRMVQSWRDIPHAWAMVEADVTGLVKLREKLKDEFLRSEGVPLTYVPFWIRAVVQCLREEPRLNATWDNGKIVVHRHINVGLAVGVEGGLVVPVIRNAEEHSTISLAKQVYRLAEKARQGRLTVDDVQGATITLNNTGALGVVLSKSIVNPPQTAILNLEAIVRRPVVVGDAIAIRSMVNLSIAFDHRVVDGFQVGRFLQNLKARMEAYGEGTSLY